MLLAALIFLGFPNVFTRGPSPGSLWLLRVMLALLGYLAACRVTRWSNPKLLFWCLGDFLVIFAKFHGLCLFEAFLVQPLILARYQRGWHVCGYWHFLPQIGDSVCFPPNPEPLTFPRALGKWVASSPRIWRVFWNKEEVCLEVLSDSEGRWSA